MWIKSQNRRILLRTNCLKIIGVNSSFGIVTDEKYCYEPLAIYSTYEAAEKMMAVIEDAIIFEPNSVVYMLAEDELD